MKRILIAEDSKSLSEELCAELKDEGFHCESAYTVGSALKKLRSGRFHLLICDIRMPTAKNEGIALIRKVRKLEKEGKIQRLGVIVITAYSNKRNAIQTLKLGAFDYLEKKFSINAFVDSVKKYFAEEAQKDRVIQALEGWIRRHPRLGKQKLFFSGEKEGYSPIEVLDEIKAASEDGLKFKDALLKATLDSISKPKE